MSQLRVVSIIFSVLLLGIMLGGTVPIVSYAQDTSDIRAATGGAQTLEEILRRQESLIDGATLNPRRYRAGQTPPPETAPLGPRGGTSLSDMWDQFRGGNPTELLGTVPAQQNMSTTGQTWRLLRERLLRKYLGWAPVVVLAVLALFYIVRGPIRIAAGRSGQMIPRFDVFQRLAHWFLATIFLFLGTTGLLILLGRSILVPLIGKEANSIILTASMQGHNLFGPIFIVSLVWMFIKFASWNFFHVVDLKWIFKLGGFFGGHASSGKFNFGEKTWFWMVVLVGLVLSVTGIVLLFPWLVGDIRWLQLSTVLHVIGAVTLISVALGHIYVGSVGMEGSLEAMTKGEVDANWAKEHHDLWFEQVQNKNDKAHEVPE